jgi:hypothetical protein
MRRESAEQWFLSLGDPHEAVEALLTTVEAYGSLKLFKWRDTDDAWGKHYDLYIERTTHGEWNLTLEVVCYWLSRAKSGG